jgi:hypothetical protein
MNHPILRKLVDEANTLALAERLTPLKAIVPHCGGNDAGEFRRSSSGFARRRALHDAMQHPEGGAARHVMGERELEGR